ncbi:MAG: TonB-dependent receptor [Ignavibacteriaceae bacterium]
MKNLVALFFFINSLLFAQQITLKGKVEDSQSNQPLANANITIVGKPLGTITNADGIFLLKGNISSNDFLVVSYVGYETQKILLTSGVIKQTFLVQLKPEIIPAQTILVEGSMGKQGTSPLAFEKITRKEISENYTLQDIPEYLGSLPSTTFYSENGNGIGYNYLSIRGFDQRRISVSVNGIPQNDPEDHNVYWLDFPDLLSSTEVIQVQRGAGSGIVGYPAIGGTINIITSTFSNTPQLSLSAAAGSYNTRKYSASFSSGLIDKKYSIYAKLSQILSSGYRNGSWTNFTAYYLSAVRYDENLTTQINFYGGPIADGLAYNGLPKFAIKDVNLRKANYSDWGESNGAYTYTVLRRPSEIENFSQPHFELLNEYRINKNTVFNSAAFLVIGNGFFDYDGSWADTTMLRLTSQYGFHPTQNPVNTLIMAEVDNTQFGWIPRLSIKYPNAEIIFGAEFREHRSTHWGSIAFGEELPVGLTHDYRFYYFNGGKDIVNGYVHGTFDVTGAINVLAEIQVAYHKYSVSNERFLNNDFSVSNTFLNPKFGVNYKFNQSQNLYFSFARVSSEPILSAYYEGESSSFGAVPQFQQNPDGTYNYNQPYVLPETMNDLELGTSFIKNNFSLSLDLYYMIFNDEIVNNGKLDLFGQPITGNMKSTLHRGIELSGIYMFNKSFEVHANATYSSNVIQSGIYFIGASEAIDLSGNKIGGFPDFLANLGLTYKNDGLFLQLTAKYVGAFYSDNFDNNLNQYLYSHPGFVGYNDNQNDAYFTSDFFGSYELNIFDSLTPAKIFVQVNNIFNRLYSANAIGAEFFPAAERNFLTGIQIGL